MMTFKQKDLPYDLGALAPFASEEQMHYHFNKHHAAYYRNLNTQLDGKADIELPLEVVVAKSEGGVFNNAAQAWNHAFFWECMSPNGGGKPAGDLLALIERDFGSYDVFKEQFSSAAAKLFGAGWAWLAQDEAGKLEILALSNADTPLKHGKKALLTLDVWEHAYYIDYRNERPRFVEGFWDGVNWDFAAKNI
jgi:Fe-Mn family superoxide dismutase